MSSIKIITVKIAYFLAQIYWFIFRPIYRGAKIVLTHNNKMLMIRHTYGGYYWTFPGGKINKKETPEEAVKREVLEELNIEIDQPILTGLFPLNNEYKKDTIYCFWAELDRQDFKIDLSEIAEAKWFPIGELPEKTGKNARRIYYKARFKLQELSL